jgi:hypothetical protein
MIVSGNDAVEIGLCGRNPKPPVLYSDVIFTYGSVITKFRRAVIDPTSFVEKI